MAECEQWRAAVCIPQPHVILGPGQNTGFITAEHRAQHFLLMLQREQQLAAAGVPKSHGTITGPGQDTISVSREGRARHLMLVLQRQQLAAAVCIPQPHDAVLFR